MSSIPRMMALTASHEDGVALVRSNMPVPMPGEGEVLVQVLYAGQNPSDAFALDTERSSNYYAPAHILGCDLSGIVIDSRSDTVPKGSQICAWVPGGTSTQGSFAEYVVCDAEMVICVPLNTSLQVAAALPFSFFTALHALQVALKLDVDPTSAKDELTSRKKETTILVWGAGTACGYYALQLLHLAGYQTIAIAGVDSQELLRSIGVSNFIKRDDTKYVCTEVKKRWPSLQYALDCHASQESLDATIGCFGIEENGNTGRIHTLLPIRPSVEIAKNLKISFDLVHTMTGKRLPILTMIEHQHSSEQLVRDHQLAKKWANYDRGILYDMLLNGHIKTLSVELWGERRSLINNTEGKLSGIKDSLELVYKGLSPVRGKIVHAIG